MSHAVSSYNLALILGAGLSAIAALLHVAIVFGGAPWYRFFGAGEKFAQAALKGHGWHDVLTLGIAVVLGVWAAYAFSGAGAGLGLKLPWLKEVLWLITAAYLLRGIGGFGLLVTRPTGHSVPFIVVSSLICLAIGVVHWVGIWQISR